MNETEKQTIRVIVDALKTFEVAKEDKKEVIDAAFEDYQAADGRMTKKGLIAVAKAVIATEVEEAKEFHQAVADALSEI